MKTFKVNYRILSDPPSDIKSWVRPQSSAVSALGAFHYSMQCELMIPPHRYKVESMVEVYNSDPSGLRRGENIESAYDLPASPNPDLLNTADKPLVNTLFPFIDEVDKQCR